MLISGLPFRVLIATDLVLIRNIAATFLIGFCDGVLR